MYETVNNFYFWAYVSTGVSCTNTTYKYIYHLRTNENTSIVRIAINMQYASLCVSKLRLLSLWCTEITTMKRVSHVASDEWSEICVFCAV